MLLGDFYFIWEFSVDFTHIFSIPPKEAYELLKETSILNPIVYEIEMKKRDSFDSKAYSRIIHRPFVFDNISFEDFDIITHIDEFKNHIKEYYFLTKEDVDDVEILELYRDLYNRIIDNVSKRMLFKNPVLHLSRDKLLKTNESKLDELHEIHHYYELFIEFDKEKEVVRIIDIGHD